MLGIPLMVVVRKQVTMIASGENIQTSDRDRVAYGGLSESSSSSTYGQFNRVQA
jgi:hypothetical protein